MATPDRGQWGYWGSLARKGRMNTELVAATWEAAGRRLAVLDDGEVDDDLARDMAEVLTSGCARWSARRSARHRAGTALEAAHHG